jgi:hypothetical protein
LRKQFHAALTGDLPDSIATATPIQVELSAAGERPAALSLPSVQILQRGEKLIVAKGLRAGEWRALLEDRSVTSLSRYSANVVKERFERRDESGLDPRHAPRQKNFLPALEPFDLKGQGAVIALIDVGAVAHPHPSFAQDGAAGSRVTVITRLDPDRHSTHMASVIGASWPEAVLGVAPKARILNYDYDGADYDQVLGALDDADRAGTVVSNHSFGPHAGWEGGTCWYGGDTLVDARFGRYDAMHRSLDEFLSSHPRHIAFAAAGNERGEAGPSREPCAQDPRGCCRHQMLTAGGTWVQSDECRPPDGGEDGWDTLRGACVAKNSVCMANVERMGENSWTPRDRSSYGPTDDLRLKPDLSAEGYEVNVTGLINPGGPEWGHSSGTSSATALASGIGTLMVQYFSRVNGGPPIAAEIKGVLIHTARRFPHPDLQQGWGVIDAGAARQAIDGTDGSRIVRAATTQRTIPIRHDLALTSGKLRITLVWTDPPGALDRPFTLTNDLDIVLIGPGGKEHLPYRVNSDGTIGNGRNDRDNVEGIQVVDPTAGAWRLEIRAPRVTGSQEYALVISGARLLN